jgi:hypothetical protein
MPRSSPRFRSLVALPLLAALTAVSGCVLLIRGGEVEPVDPAAPPVSVAAPLRAHLVDGSVAVFRQGGTFADDTVRGAGVRYGLALEDSTAVRRLPLDSVVAMETYRESVRPGASVAASALGTVLGTVGTAALAVAAFGSCPTVYSAYGPAAPDSLVLEAESFSNSIAPLLEIRDVDALRAQPDASGALTLEIRNEALETHYINHLELVEVGHAPGERALPTGDGRAWVVGETRRPSTAVDEAGRDLTAVLGVADGRAYRTPSARLRDRLSASTAPEDALSEHLDLTFPPPETDSVAVLLRLRNSLLNTVLFYEYMLAAQGPHALDWLGHDMDMITSVMALSDFYARRMGLRVQVHAATGYQTVGRVREVGPIAWSPEAIPVPVPPGRDSLRIRLSFVPDAWRIDQVALADRVRRSDVRRHPVSTVRLDAQDAAPSDAARTRLARPDHDYWVTRPTDRFWATFDPGPDADGTARSFFLAAQGYYTEWIRREWLRTSPREQGLAVSDDTLVDALRRWQRSRPDWEARFHASKLPVE